MAETCTHVRKLLDQQQLKYTVASDGSYVTLNFGYEKNRPPGRPRARGVGVPCARRAEDVAPYQPVYPVSPMP